MGPLFGQDRVSILFGNVVPAKGSHIPPAISRLILDEEVTSLFLNRQYRNNTGKLRSLFPDLSHPEKQWETLTDNRSMNHYVLIQDLEWKLKGRSEMP